MFEPIEFEVFDTPNFVIFQFIVNYYAFFTRFLMNRKWNTTHPINVTHNRIINEAVIMILQESKLKLSVDLLPKLKFLINFINGVKGNTLGSYSAVLRKLAKNTDLTPEAVKEFLAKTQEWNEATKQMVVIVYGSFLKFNNLT